MTSEIISVVGLGYVGLPLASALADYHRVIGFDIDRERIFNLTVHGLDKNGEVSSNDLFREWLSFASEPDRLKDASFHIVAVPTPVDAANRPDLTALKAASEVVGRAMKRGSLIVYESTVAPGTTEGVCVEWLEAASGLKFRRDFDIGFSPERANPGDKNHGLANVVKVVSASCENALMRMREVYGPVCLAGLHCAPSIQVAEAAKLLENIQRDVNIGLMNEFAMACNAMKINTLDVIEAASTKWNFVPFTPGLVGGHCIGVDPYYMIDSAENHGLSMELLKTVRRVNNSMSRYVAMRSLKTLASHTVMPRNPTVTILGVTFKENCPDVRNSRSIEIYDELLDFGCEVQLVDPVADANAFAKENHAQIITLDQCEPADILIIAVKHKQFLELTPTEWCRMINPDGIIFDVKGTINEEMRTRFNLPVARL